MSCRVSPQTLEDFISFLWTKAIFPCSLVIEQVTNESRFLIFKLSDFAALVGNLLKTIKNELWLSIAGDFTIQCHKFQWQRNLWQEKGNIHCISSLQKQMYWVLLFSLLQGLFKDPSLKLSGIFLDSPCRNARINTKCTFGSPVTPFQHFKVLLA